MEDVSRPMHVPWFERSATSMLARVVRSFRLNPRSGQRPVVVVCENAALTEFLRPTTMRAGVALMGSRGFASDGAIRSVLASFRLQRRQGCRGKGIVLMLVDHDPSGAFMPADLKRRLLDLGGDADVRVVSVLRRDVRRRGRPLPHGCRDPRAYQYRRACGGRVLQLTDVRDSTHRARLRKALKTLTDARTLRHVRARERHERARLRRSLSFATSRARVRRRKRRARRSQTTSV
jgi:hypothetical protein